MQVRQHLAERLMNFLTYGENFRFSVKREQERAAFHEIADWLNTQPEMQNQSNPSSGTEEAKRLEE